MKWMESMRIRSRVAGSWMLMIASAAAFLWALIMPLCSLGLTAEETTLQEAYESGQIIRLHILAEDDSPRAQKIKLAVRDTILAAFGEEIKKAGAMDADTVYALLVQRKEAMLAVAEQTARQYGFDGEVTAQVGVLTLPEKAYGDVTLPEGEYRALRITLGQGQGQNWWCVLFPELCLALASDEPWQVSPRQTASIAELEWHSLEVFRHWLLLPESPN